MNSSAQPIAITLGDAAGIGPEIIAKAFREAPEATRGCFVVGDGAVMRRAAGWVSAGRPALPVALIETAAQALDAPPQCIPVLQIAEQTMTIPCGQVSGKAGKLAAECVVWAARAALRGEVAAIVTAPLHKEALAAAGEPWSRYPGHTELLQAEAAAWAGKPLAEVPVRMMLANDELRTVLVSIHVSLRDALDAVTLENVLQTICLTHDFLCTAVGLAQRAPRIAVAGLNPHAGEGGRFGREEIEVIAPAVRAAQAAGIDAHGPFAPDTVFMRARAPGGDIDTAPGEFDAVVAMYHDQGLIPVKYLGVEQGVNVTVGLQGDTPRPWRLVRTSPDHGTAFDIAGTGRADASSLIAAIRMARRLVSRA